MSNSTSTQFSTEAYLSADAKGKAGLRSAIQSAITSAIEALDITEAARLVAIQKTFTTPKATVEVDWKGRIVDLHATLTAALNMIETGNVRMPEGVEVPDLSDVDWSTGTADAALADKVATVAGRKAGRGAVVAWLESVVDDTPATISQLRARWVATSDYPKAPPSAGAIGAAFDRIEAGAEADFTVLADADGKGHRGAQA